MTTEATAAGEATRAGTGADKPVIVTFDRNQPISRLWGIPFLGLAARWIALIPHVIVFWFLAIGLGLAFLVSWIPVLFTGRQATAISNFIVGAYRYYVRFTAWGFMLVAPYPPIASWSAPYPVDVFADTDRPINRLWGIPLLGFYARALVVIPQAIVLFALGLVISLSLLVMWIPILLNGRMPQLGYDLYGGYLRLATRTSLYVALVPVPYPPLTPGE